MPQHRRRPPPSPLSPARVLRRATIARTTARSPQVFPNVTRTTYRYLPDELKHGLLQHSEKLCAKLRRDLGPGWREQVVQPYASPGSTDVGTASTANSNAAEAAANAPTQSPPQRTGQRRHQHPNAWTPSPGSPGRPADDPERNGTRGRALWPSPIPWGVAYPQS